MRAPAAEALAVLVRANIHARRSDIEWARKDYASAQRKFREMSDGLGVVDTLIDLAEAELLAGNLDAALEAVERAKREGDLGQHADLRIRAVAVEAKAVARTEEQQGLGEISDQLYVALSTAEVLESPKLIWQCHSAAADLAEARGHAQRAQQHATSAWQILRQMAERLPAELSAAFWQDPIKRSLRDHLEQQLEEEGIDLPEEDCGGVSGEWDATRCARPGTGRKPRGR